MLTIYKYLLTSTPIDMPMEARILSVQMQDNEPFIWAMVNTEMPTKRRRFIVYGTGAEIMPSDLKFLTYLATMQDGPFVLHIFEVKE